MISDPTKSLESKHPHPHPPMRWLQGTCCMAVSTTSWSFRTSKGAFDRKALFPADQGHPDADGEVGGHNGAQKP